MKIEFDGRMVEEAIYLRRKQRAERLARLALGDARYDEMRLGILPGSASKMKELATREVSRRLRFHHYLSSVHETGRVDWLPRNS